jgi:hypothetical protein
MALIVSGSHSWSAVHWRHLPHILGETYRLVVIAVACFEETPM